MKKHNNIVQIAIFSVIFAFFLLPPLFVSKINSQDSVFFDWNFPFLQILLAVFSLIFFFFYIYEKKEKLELNKYLINFSITLSFGLSLLFCISLIIKGISYLFPVNEINVEIIKPQTFIQFLFCLLTFISGAVYEEIMYRVFVPEALYLIINPENYSTKKARILKISIEVFGILIFSLAHIYEGVFAVLNAALAQMLLRYLFKRFNNLPALMLAHFLYNLLALYLI